MKPLRSVDLATLEESAAAIERSDVCAVPAAAVVGEAMVASCWPIRSSSGAVATAWPHRRNLAGSANVRHRMGCSRAPADAVGTSDPMGRPILRYGDPLLHGRRAGAGTTSDLQTLIDDMIETMHAAPGIGLAAPQVGVPARCWSSTSRSALGRASSSSSSTPVAGAEGLQVEQEGCLSMPGFNAPVPRPAHAVVRGMDRDASPASKAEGCSRAPCSTNWTISTATCSPNASSGCGASSSSGASAG